MWREQVNCVNSTMQRCKSFPWNQLSYTIWSVSGTPTRSCACEINLNHAYLHGNGYWSADIARQLYATETFVYSVFSSLRVDENQLHGNVILRLTLTECVHIPSMHSTSRGGMQRWEYPNSICYQTVSYEAEELWSPVVHTANHMHRIRNELIEK